MNLPPFEEFIASIKEDGYSIYKDINIYDVIVFEGPTTPENIQAYTNHVINDVARFSSLHAMATLKAYHEWLQKQI